MSAQDPSTGSHPDALQLDALALGEPVRSTTQAHVDECAECTQYVIALRAELEGPPLIAPRPVPRLLPWRRAAYALVPTLAAAAGLLFFLRTELPPPVPPPGPTAETVHFKGGLPLAVVRERDGAQARFTDRVPVRAGDRLRVEVSLDVARPITVVVVDEHGGAVTALPAALLEPGTHYSDVAVRIDEHPRPGWVLAGEPAAVETARRTQQRGDVAAIPIELEAP